jgi:uncharacterized protein (TIGR02145 family)
VQDADTEESVQDVEVKLFHTNDLIGTDTTGMDGSFLFTNLEQSDYTIELKQELYESHTEDVTVFPATTSELEIILRGEPNPEFSTSELHFGLESTQLSFSILNSGGGILPYDIIPTQDWISVFPESGEITEESEVIEVNIQKGGLQEVSHQAWITIRSDILGETQIDTIDVYVNYVMDENSTIYKTVRIGTQVWMAENLNTGIMVEEHGDDPTSDNGLIEKLCYGNNPLNCEIYGGLYMWEEAMDYAEADTGGIRITQGVCPDGWHIPTTKEWKTLIEFLGEDLAGGMLKDTSALWRPPNLGASNETGFTALPAGAYYSNTYLGTGEFRSLGDFTWFWSI